MSEQPGYNPEQEVTEGMLENAIIQAEDEITNQEKNPINDVLARTDQLGFFAAIGEAAKPHAKNIAKISFIDLKATASGALALIPLLGEGQAAAIIGSHVDDVDRFVKSKDLYEAAILEGARPLRAAMEVGKSGLNVAIMEPIEIAKAIRTAQTAAPEAIKAVDIASNNAKSTDKEIKKSSKLLDKLRKKNKNLPANAVDANDPVQYFRSLLDMQEKNPKLYDAITRYNQAVQNNKDTQSAFFRVMADARDALNPRQMEIFKKALEQYPNLTIDKALHFAAQGMITETKSQKLLFGLKKVIPQAIHAIDPTPDVPQAVSLAAWGVELFGIHGAGVIPAAWQLAKNRVDWIKEGYGMGKDVTTIIVDRTKKKVAGMREPKVMKAAEAFV